MKYSKLFGSLLLTTICLSGIAQTKTKFIELSTTPYFIDGTYRIIGSPSFGMQFNKHTVALGPTILFASDIVTSNKKFPKLTGAQLDYSYFPNGTDDRWNVFFFSQFTLQTISDKWSSVIYNNQTKTYQEFKYLNKEIQFLSNFGYGIELTVSDKINFFQSVGIGYYFIELDGKAISINAPEVAENLGEGYAPHGLVLSGRFGISYKL